MNRAICVRETAHRRALAEAKTVYDRLSEEDLSGYYDEQGRLVSTRSLKFAKQLEDTARSLRDELDKAISDKDASLVRYKQKHDKLWEEYSRD